MATRANRRVLADIGNMQTEETKSLRMYYVDDETNSYKGCALLLGPEGSPYEDLPVLLEIEFPSDYPFTSPKAKFITYDGTTRFHPNLYVEGKVCLSILGTWQGPSWTSVMTLKTVLLSIMGILDEEPLLHEPGYASMKGSQKSKEYTSFVEHSSLRYIVSTLEKYSKDKLEPVLKQFHEFPEHIPKIYKRTLERVVKLAQEPKKVWSKAGGVYEMSGASNYPELLTRLQSISLPCA